MQSSSHIKTLELSLHQSLEAYDFETAKKLIKTFDRLKNVSLKAHDEQNRNFLCHAFNVNAHEIVQMIFSRMQDDISMALEVDADQRTMMWHAAAYGNVTILKHFILLAKQHGDAGFWLKSDKFHRSPLFATIPNGSIEALKLLLKEIQGEVNFLDVIHQLDLKGNTALHKACMCHQLEIIALLFMHFSDLHLHNNQNKTPFQLISQFSIQDQLTIFSYLDTFSKERFLDIYHDHLGKDLSSDLAKTFYYQASSRLGLRFLLRAHLDFNESMSIQSTYQHSRIGVDKDGQVVLANTKIPLELFAFIPHYTNRLSQILNQNLLRETYPLETPSPYQILDTDKCTITTLMNDTHSFIRNLQARDKITFSYYSRTASIAIPLLCALGILGIALFCALKAHDTSERLGKLKYDDPSRHNLNFEFLLYLIGSICSAFVGLCISLAACPKGLPHCFWSHKVIVNKREWQNLLKRVEEDVQTKLQLLEQKQLNSDNQRYLPTNVTHLRNLEALTTRLNNHQSLNKAITIFNNIHDLLKQIRLDLNLSGKPLTSFENFDLEAQAREANEEETANERSSLLV